MHCLMVNWLNKIISRVSSDQHINTPTTQDHCFTVRTHRFVYRQFVVDKTLISSEHHRIPIVIIIDLLEHNCNDQTMNCNHVQQKHA